VLTQLATSGHLVYHVLCFVLVIFPHAGSFWLGFRKLFLLGPEAIFGPASAAVLMNVLKEIGVLEQSMESGLEVVSI
jgi:hypothetical protein